MAELQALTEVLHARSTDSHHVTFIEAAGQEKSLSYQTLYSQALGVLAKLQEGGMHPGDQLILLLADNERFIESFWASALGGIVPVPVAWGIRDTHRHKLLQIYQKLESGYLCTDASTLERLKEFASSQGHEILFEKIKQRTFVSDELFADADLSGSAPKLHSPNLDDPAFIQFSSGSTSAPKGVVITHRNLATNINSIVHGMQMSDTDQMLSWMPLTHDMSLIGFHLTPVFKAINQSVMPTDLFVRRPALWLSTAQAHNSTLLCSPNFGYEHYLKAFARNRPEALDLDCVRLIFNGAEPISAKLCDRFMSALAPFGLKASTMYPVYGLAEATLAVSFPALQSPFEVLRLDRSSLTSGHEIKVVTEDSDASTVFVCVGKPVKDCEVSIQDSERKALPENTIGHINIRGDNVTRGYYAEEELSRAIITPDGWLDTGDLGFLRHGKLYITGRAKDIIFINGQNFYPHDLEELVIQAGFAEFGKIAVSSFREKDGTADRILCFVQSREDSEKFGPRCTSIAHTINSATGTPLEAVIPVGRLPKTTSGKVQRFMLVDDFQKGEFDDSILELERFLQSGEDTNTASTGSDIAATLTEICQSNSKDIQIGVDDNLFDIGISSLTLAEIHAQIEDTWPDQVDITDLFDYPSITELSGFLQDKLGQ